MFVLSDEAISLVPLVSLDPLVSSDPILSTESSSTGSSVSIIFSISPSKFNVIPADETLPTLVVEAAALLVLAAIADSDTGSFS